MEKKMYRITIITRKDRFEEFRKELVKVGVTGMTVTKVEGFGTQKGIRKLIEGVMKNVDMLPKLKIEIVVCSVPVDTVIDIAKKVLQTGNIGDGKIFVSDIDRVVRIRTGEENADAL